MAWSVQLFTYCERGLDPSFWAEPVNALSNLAFPMVAALAAIRLRRVACASHSVPGHTATERRAVGLLIGLTATIGPGSFLFHTLATRWAQLADVIPITLFMVAYLAFALRYLIGCRPALIAVAVVAFLIAGRLAADLRCPVASGAAASGETSACLNGSLGYVPALLTVFLVGALVARHSPAGRRLLAAGGVFAAALTVRTIDQAACASTVLFGAPRGTHVFWHLLVAATLSLLLEAAIRHVGSCSGTGEPTPRKQGEA